LLIFQAVFTFLLFASSSEGDEDTPITLTIRGGTNVTFSPSWEYLDQVLLPALERFGIKGVERRVGWRGWSHGRSEVGDVWIKFRPVKRGTALKAPEEDVFETPGRVEKINISLVVPKEIRTLLLDALKLELELVFPGIKTQVIVDEDSRHMSRIYVLLVAQTANGHHLGQDCLYSRSIKGKLLHQLATEVSQKVVDELDAEVRKCMCVDEHLQDQLVVFQALAGGRSYIGYGEDKDGKERMDRDDEPFGVGDMHAKTARWVVSQLLPEVKWRENGRACEGVGWKCEKSLEEELESLSLAEASTSSKKV
jgi:RNA 3'-terminal phosphate cyclase (ATP)